MGQLHVEGPQAGVLLQGLLSNDLDRIGDGEAQYTLLTNERGGIVDDLIAYRIARSTICSWSTPGTGRPRSTGWKGREVRGSEVRDASDDYGLLAVQGPTSVAALGLSDAPSFTHAMGEVRGVEVMICRTGYTGEAGCRADVRRRGRSRAVGRGRRGGTTPCGLGARDTLRLEVCYPLHGNDIDAETDPISAGLGGLRTREGVQRRRRAAPDRGGGAREKLVAFVMDEKAVPRQGMAIAGGGEVTSGHALARCSTSGIGMGYVPAAAAVPETELVIDVRGKPRRAHVVKKPIYVKEGARWQPQRAT